MSKAILSFIIFFLVATSFWLGTQYSTTEMPVKTQKHSISSVSTLEKDSNEKKQNTIPQYTNARDVVSSDDGTEDISNSTLQEIKKIRRELAKERRARRTTDTKYADARQKLKDAGLEVPEYISLEEVEKTLPSPFSKVVANGGERLVNNFKKLETEEFDYDWGDDMQVKISDFIAIHELSNGVDLQSVRCKTTICEIRGFDKNVGDWKKIYSDMTTQDWWKFGGITSINSNTDKDGFFYILAAKSQKR